MYQTLNNEHTQTVLIIAKLFLVLTQSTCSLGLIYFVLFKLVSRPSHCREVPRQPVGLDLPSQMGRGSWVGNSSRDKIAQSGPTQAQADTREPSLSTDFSLLWSREP